MKKITLFIAALFISGAIIAQDGIQFVKDKSWNDILSMAKESEKLIFVDAYTTWCGPCKKMSKEIFPQKEVGNYYNDQFINVKMDMEKGEGLNLAQEYNVRAYPTLLFINAEGVLVHRIAGYMVAEEFIALGRQANNPEMTLSAMDKKYEDGERDADFLYSYTEARYNAADGSHAKIADEYLKTQKDWNSEKNMEFMFQYINDPKSKAFMHIIKNRKEFSKVFGDRMVTQKIQNLIYNQIYYSDPKPTMDQVEKIYQKYYPEKADLLFANYKMSYHRQLGDREGYAKAAIDRFDNIPCDDYSEYNEAAWTFYEVIKDEDQLKKALGWAKKSVKLAPRYENTDTVAHLYYKLGKKGKAKKAAKKAIKLAKAKDEDYGITQELLDKINKK